jgi:PAS domain S-box-containing protein
MDNDRHQEPRSVPEPPSAAEAFLAGTGEMATRIREHDWANTPLGPVADWPQSLRSAMSILVSSKAQLCMFWGPELINIYNDAYRPTLGAKHPWALGRPAREVWSEIWDGVLGPLFDGVVRTGNAFWASDHLFFLQRHGYREETFFDVSYDPVRDESGGVGGVFCITSETTGRVVGERRLRTLRDLSAVASEAATMDDAFREAARVLGRNPQDVPFALLFDNSGGMQRARCVAATGADPAAPGGWPLDEALAGEILLAGAALRSHGPLAGAPSSEPLREVMVLPMSIAGHPPVGVLVAGISPHRALDESYRGFLRLAASHIAEAAGAARALEQHRARAEALAELDRAKSAFFSNVSHEFRTPLTLMLSPLEDLLARRPWESQADRELVSVAHRNGLRLLKLVNALLDFSRLEAGRTQLQMEPVDLAEYTAELASVFRSAMHKADLQFRVDCAPLGAAVYVDRDAWEKIVLNLLSNALKYTLQGSVSVALQEVAGHAVLAVADTGEGIPDHEQQHIFNRFHRVHGTRARTHEGTGIGLSLVQELARLHSGTVTVASREGQGSTFRVAIPLGTRHVAPEAMAAASARRADPSRPSLILEEVKRWLPDDGAAAGPGPAPDSEIAVRGRVVLADDNADMREYVRRLLQQDGYLVEAVGDGRAALLAIERQRPDLLLTDVMMPGMDGFALLRAVRSHSALNDIAVVMLSARAGEESTVEGFDRGVDDYLVKPFSAVELKARVRASIGISRLRRATGERERALRLEAEAERDRLRTVLAGIRDHFVVLDRDWKFSFVSDSWCTLTGLAREQVAGRTVWELFPAVIGTEWEATARRVMATRQPASLDYWYEPYGAWWDLRMAPAPDGAISQLTVDITERRRAEVERAQLLDSERAARAEAERATRIKDEFLATLSHELRTPLNAITGWTHLLRRSPGDVERVRMGVDVIERNTRMQTQLISDLLDMSRIVTGKMRLEVQRVELPVVLDAAVESLAPAAEAKGVRLQTIVEPIADPFHGDPSRIQQIVWNLLSNAIKFTGRGGSVQLVLSRAGSQVEITVRDTGQGLHPEFLPHVFERFRQADGSAARPQGGLGIGLALVKQLTELHGGRVRVASEGEGKGATFVVELPLALLRSGDDGSRRHPQVAVLAGGGAAAPLDLSGLRVLLVDDEPDALEVVQRLLEECRIVVIAAVSAENATELAERYPFDLILSDIGMPRRDGYQFIAEVRRRGIKTPAAALTAFARTEDKTRALLAGYQAHIVKPIDPAELYATVAALAGRTAPSPTEPAG